MRQLPSRIGLLALWILAGCGGGEADPATPDAGQPTCPSGWGTGTFFRNATAADIAACVEAGESLRTRNSEGDTPLHLAASVSDDPEVIRALINAGARPDGRETIYPLEGPISGITPLHNASFGPGANLEAVEALLRAGADPNLLDDTGRTPLDWAEHRGLTQMAALLREHGGRNSG